MTVMSIAVRVIFCFPECAISLRVYGSGYTCTVSCIWEKCQGARLLCM
jgi:hypothetical protein